MKFTHQEFLFSAHAFYVHNSVLEYDLLSTEYVIQVLLGLKVFKAAVVEHDIQSLENSCSICLLVITKIVKGTILSHLHRGANPSR